MWLRRSTGLACQRPWIESLASSFYQKNQFVEWLTVHSPSVSIGDMEPLWGWLLQPSLAGYRVWTQHLSSIASTLEDSFLSGCRELESPYHCEDSGKQNPCCLLGSTPLKRRGSGGGGSCLPLKPCGHQLNALIDLLRALSFPSMGNTVPSPAHQNPKPVLSSHYKYPF